MKTKERVIYLDLIRALAIFMVLITHATEVFYITGAGQMEIKDGDGIWVNLINSAVRACVPLFVVVSGYLLLPIKQSASDFYRKRLSKIFIPFIIWSLLYVFVPLLWGGTNQERILGELTRLTYNFNWASGHLWFMYMLLGIYLFMPIISPWLKECSRRFEEGFLAVWAFTTLYHYITQFIPDHMMLGEAFWNEFGAIWYFSGYIGYIVLGHYIKKYIHWNRQKLMLVGSSLFIIGFAITALVFDYQMHHTDNIKDLELSWRFCTINVALMTAGIFLMLKDVNFTNEKVRNMIVSFSKYSFGIYLCHMFTQKLAFMIIGDTLATPIAIFSAAILNYIIAYIVVRLMAFLPKSEYVLGT
ncbi:acyltransferase [Sediminitomix flava]|uniref:Surface polysaccharide O-acyltransferase-like enzyme n=1 Tax=Sediminitomix flava TaxID=379075 RepID=A0A315Z6W8_SEDFL|nr:acyltransferase [Sediminitomix flava]PWJ40178.1 surface polysaccharide O-acyltransferase-like enzyme [Sediminitomix flava]